MAKFKYFGSRMFVISTLSWTWLIVKSKYLRSGNQTHVILDLAKCQVHTLWVWHFVRSTLPYLFGCAKKELSFFWTCLREDAHSLRHAWGLAYCQVQSCLGLASVKPNISRAWHTAKPSHFQAWLEPTSSLGTPKGITTSSPGHAEGDNDPLLDLARGKSLVFMSSTISDVLDPNLPILFRCIKFL